MEINKFIKKQMENWLKIYDKNDYYYKVGYLLRYHYVGSWGNHFFVSEKEQKRWNNKLWNWDRPRLIIPKTTKQTMKNNFFYTLKRDKTPKIPTYRGNR